MHACRHVSHTVAAAAQRGGFKGLRHAADPGRVSLFFNVTQGQPGEHTHTHSPPPPPTPKNVPDRFQPLVGPFGKPTIGIRSHRDYLIFTSGPKNADSYDIYNVFSNFPRFSCFSFGAIFGKLQSLLWFRLKCLVFMSRDLSSLSWGLLINRQLEIEATENIKMFTSESKT